MPTRPEPKTVEVSLLVLLAVLGLAARQGEEPLRERLGAILRENAIQAVAASGRRSRRVQALWRGVLDGSNDMPVMPFHLDPVTGAAAALFLARREATFRIYPIQSFVDLGCLELSGEGIRHVLQASDLRFEDAAPEFPSFGTQTEWLERLERAGQRPPVLSFAQDRGDCLRVAFPQSLGSPDFLGRPMPASRAALVRQTDDGGTDLADLGAVRISTGDDGAIEVMLASEQQLRLHAAYFEGAMLVIEGRHDFLISPIPSLEIDGAPESCRATLTEPNGSRFQFNDIRIPMPEDLVLGLMRRFWWFNPMGAKSALQLARKMAKPSPIVSGENHKTFTPS